MNGVKIQSCCDSTIAASELRNGQVAVIVRNGFGTSWNGSIVTRHTFCGADHLALFGRAMLFSTKASELTGEKCRVRVLKAGEQITIC